MSEATENQRDPRTLVEVIRGRPGMFIGGTKARDFIYLVRHLLSETVPGFKAEAVHIDILEAGRFRVTWTVMETDIALDLVEVKFPMPYMHLAVLIAVSAQMEMRVQMGNAEWRNMVFEAGELVKGKEPLEFSKVSRLELEFSLDPSIWVPGIQINSDHLVQEVRDLAFLLNETKFGLAYTAAGEACKVTFRYPKGMLEAVEALETEGTGGIYFASALQVKLPGIELQAAWAYREYEVDAGNIRTYTNDMYTPEDGTHLDALLKGLTFAVMRYFQKNKLTEIYRISEKYMRQGLLVRMNVRLENPEYSGCVRHKLANSEIIEPIAKAVADHMFSQIEKHPEATKRLISRFEI